MSTSTVVLAFDGTSNRDKPGTSRDTVVKRFADLMAANGFISEYIPGPGTDGSLVWKCVDQVIGLFGVKRAITRARKAIEDYRGQGIDDWIVVSYSRGGAAAVPTIRDLVESGGRVKAVVLVDPVYSLGSPLWIRWLDKAWCNDIPDGVPSYQAVALCEHRPGYSLTPVNGAQRLCFRLDHTVATGVGGNQAVLHYMAFLAGTVAELDLPIVGSPHYEPHPPPERPRRGRILTSGDHFAAPDGRVHVIP